MHDGKAETTLEQRIRRLEDIEEIKKLKGLYCKYNDGGWPEQGGAHLGPGIDLFTEDAEWDGRPYLFHARNRQEIYQAILAGREMPFVLHCPMTPIIEVDGDTATGHWHVIVFSTLPDGSSHWQVGNYLEDYVRTAEGWRFRKIRFVTARVFPQPAGWAAGPPFAAAEIGRFGPASAPKPFDLLSKS